MKQIEGQIRIPSGCAISAVISKEGQRMTGEKIIASMKPMHDRSNGLGGGFAGYGIYPAYKDFFALHMFFDDRTSRKNCEAYLRESMEIVHAERIPTRKIPAITNEPIIWRYFVAPLRSVLVEKQVDEKEWILSSIMDDTCAGMMQAELEAHGIHFLLGDTATQFKGNTAVMKSGKELDFDVLVLAVGVRPNVTLVKDAGGSVNRGILTDAQMQTTLADIYAAGDCVETDDISLGQKRIMAILPNAYMQGHCAGVNMAGGTELFDKGIPMNSIGFFGLHAMTAGSYFTQQDGGEMTEERGERTLKRLFCKDGYLTGFMLIGNTDRAGIYTSLIREQVPLNTVDFDLLKKVVTSAAFSPETRGKKFGGVV